MPSISSLLVRATQAFDPIDTALFDAGLLDESGEAALAARRYIMAARGELGVAEVPGPGSNPRILEYLRTTNLPAAMANTEATPWCSAFANWSMQQGGETGTGTAAAVDWRNWGEHADGPSYGAIAVIDHGNGHGHVTFVAGQTPGGQTVFLGGNQNDSVNLTVGYHITEYRLPIGATAIGLPFVLDPVHQAGNVQ